MNDRLRCELKGGNVFYSPTVRDRVVPPIRGRSIQRLALFDSFPADSSTTSACSFAAGHEREYNALLRTILPAERVALWDACEKASWRPHRSYELDWLKEEAFLRMKFPTIQPEPVRFRNAQQWIG